MKSINFIVILLLSVVGCGRQNKQSADDFITVDVTNNYPKKGLILQDVMDIEYIALETNDEFITHGIVEAVGENVILVRNQRDGNIFIFDKNGKALKKINRLGQGNEEYSQFTAILLDEENNEMFVKNYSARTFLVYDLSGNFKRSFKFADTSYYDFVFNYNQDYLICYKTYLPIDTEQSCHILISKQDGSVAREIKIPVEEIKSPKIVTEEMEITPNFHLITPSNGDWVIVNTSSDTIYSYLPDGKIRPLIVRVPAIKSMEKEVFLFLNTFTDRYYFMFSMKKEVNPTTLKGFPTTNLVYDKQENAIFEYEIYNNDFSSKKQVYLNSQPMNHEIVTYNALGAHELVEAYEKEELSGKLKEIAATLDEESNPVIMLVKHKK